MRLYRQGDLKLDEWEVIDKLYASDDYWFDWKTYNPSTTIYQPR